MPLEFYTSATSVAAGGSIGFHVNNPGAGQADVNVKLALERYAPTGSVGYKVSFAAGDHTITTPGNAYEVGCNWLFFFNDTATTEIYTLSLHDALPIQRRATDSVSHAPNSSVPSPGAAS